MTTPLPPFNNMSTWISPGWTDRGSGFLTPVINPSVSNILATGALQLPAGQDYVDITFDVALPDTNYYVSTWEVENTVDTDPPKIFPVNVVQKTQLGMRVAVNAIPPTTNYTLRWVVSPVLSSVPV